MKKSQNTQNRFWKYIRYLIEPSPNITDIRQRHQARLLSALLLIIITLGGLSGAIQLLTVPGFFSTFISIIGAIIALCFAYLLARTKYYLFGAILTAITPFVASYAALLKNTMDQSAFVFMLISVLLSSMLLNIWMTLSVAFLNLLGLILLPVLQPAWTMEIVPGKISFHIMISALILIAMWQRDLIERDRQKQLSESELKFRSIFDYSVDAIGVSRDGVHIMANPAYVRMFGCDSADNLVGSSILDLIAVSERAKIQENIRRRSIGEDVPSIYETRGLRCDGTEFDMEVHVSTYELEGRLHTVPILRDITERKGIEKALRASEIRYRAIVESTMDLMCRFLPDMTLTFVNEAYCRYFGQSRDQLVGTHFLNLIPKTDWAAVQEHIASVIRNREPLTYSHEVITPHGEIRWQQWTDSTILSETGEVVELQSVGRDITEQKMAEKSLQESERRFREVLQGVNLAGIMLDRTGRITFINEFLLRITGWSQEDALGKDWFDQFLPPDIREDVRAAFSKMLVNKEIIPHYENEIVSRHGGRLLIRWNNTTLFNTSGDIIGSASIGEDITESRLMERSLRLSEEKFSQAFRASPDVIVLTSLADGRILDVNDSLSFLSGYSRDEVVGKTTAELQFWASPADRERYITVLQRDGRVRDLEVGFRIKSGEIRQALLSGEIIEVADGKYILGVIRDVTERKKTEQALRSSEERYRLLFENNPQPMWVYDTITLAFLAVNEAAINAYGYSRDEFLGMTIKDIRPADELPRLMDNISHLTGGLDHAGYWRHTKKKGQVIDVEITSHTFLFEGRKAELVLATDVTERKQAEEALKQSEETATEFQEKMRTLHEVNFELSGIESLDELYHAAVEAGLKKLGFERFALFLIEEDGRYLVGTYGTDEEGSIRTEHHVREEINYTSNKFILDWLLSRTRSIHLKNVTLHGAGRDLDRRGSNVFAIVWDGSQAIGMLAIDNYLTQSPPQPFVEELLSMYGNVIGHLITRLRNEQALRESEQRYRAIVEGTTDLICRFLPDTTLTFVNEAYCVYFGKSREQLIGTRFLSMIPETDWASIQEHFASVMEDKKPVTYTHEVVSSSGEIRWQQWTDSTILNDDGELVELQSVGRDITESHHAEEILRASEKRYRLLAQNLPDSVLLLYDHELRFIVADGPELSATGFSSEMLEGKTLWEALPVEYATLFESNMRRTLRGERFTAEMPYGDLIYRYHYVPISDNSGNVAMAMILGMNITRLKNTEDALKETQRRFITAMRATKVGVWEWDMRTNQAYWSDENYIVLGYRPGEIEAQYENWAKALHPDDLYFAEAQVAEAMNSRNDLNIEFRVIWHDGSIHWINDIGSVLVDDSGQALGMYGIQIDVSDRKIAEKEREKLIHELEAKNIEAETLRESAASVALSLDLKETASRILDQLKRVVPYDSASVQLLFGNELQILDGRGFPDGKDPTGMRFLLDQNDPAYPILNDGSPYILYSNVQEVGDRFIDYFHQHIFSWIAVPLHARGRLIGILTVDGFSVGKFTEDHARFTSTFANQVAVTLENSRLYTDLQKELGERQKAEKELRQREVILEAVAASAELLLKTSDWKAVINEILEKLGWTINASHAYLFEAHPGPEGDTLLSIRHEWSAPSFVSDLDNSLYHNMPLHEPGLERWHELVILQNQPFVGDVVKSSQREMEILNERAIKAIIDMPIVVNEKWWGVIGFDDMLNDREWTNVEIDALRVAANVLSSAIQRQLYDIALMDELYERKKLIEELEHKNAELERFTYTVSHDLKSPLVTIKGFLGFLKQDIASGNMERFDFDLERIGTAAKKMEQLLRDLLELSRIGRVLNPMANIPMDLLVQEAMNIVHGQLEAHGISVYIQPNLPTIYGDRQRLTEVLQNLLDNAVKYIGSQANPLVEIGLRGMEGDKIVIFVRDNGIGIAPQYHERVFGLFNKLDPVSEGTGIGLALVKRIIEFHGGRIWIESEGNNRGTTFCFTLQVPPNIVLGGE